MIATVLILVLALHLQGVSGLTCYWCSGVDNDRMCETRPQEVSSYPAAITCATRFCVSTKVMDAVTGRVRSFARSCEHIARGNLCIKDFHFVTCFETCTSDLCNTGNPDPAYLPTRAQSGTLLPFSQVFSAQNASRTLFKPLRENAEPWVYSSSRTNKTGSSEKYSSKFVDNLATDLDENNTHVNILPGGKISEYPSVLVSHPLNYLVKKSLNAKVLGGGLDNTSSTQKFTFDIADDTSKGVIIPKKHKEVKMIPNTHFGLQEVNSFWWEKPNESQTGIRDAEYKVRIKSLNNIHKSNKGEAIKTRNTILGYPQKTKLLNIGNGNQQRQLANNWNGYFPSTPSYFTSIVPLGLPTDRIAISNMELPQKRRKAHFIKAAMTNRLHAENSVGSKSSIDANISVNANSSVGANIIVHTNSTIDITSKLDAKNNVPSFSTDATKRKEVTKNNNATKSMLTTKRDVYTNDRGLVAINQTNKLVRWWELSDLQSKDDEITDLGLIHPQSKDDQVTDLGVIQDFNSSYKHEMNITSGKPVIRQENTPLYSTSGNVNQNSKNRHEDEKVGYVYNTISNSGNSAFVEGNETKLAFTRSKILRHDRKGNNDVADGFGVKSEANKPELQTKIQTAVIKETSEPFRSSLGNLCALDTDRSSCTSIQNDTGNFTTNFDVSTKQSRLLNLQNGSDIYSLEIQQTAESDTNMNNTFKNTSLSVNRNDNLLQGDNTVKGIFAVFRYPAFPGVEGKLVGQLEVVHGDAEALFEGQKSQLGAGSGSVASRLAHVESGTFERALNMNNTVVNNVPDISLNMNNKVHNKNADISSIMNSKVANNIPDISKNMNNKVKNNNPHISFNMNNKVDNNIHDISTNKNSKVGNSIPDFSPNMNNKAENNIPDIFSNMNNKVENNTPDISSNMNNKVQKNIPDISRNMNNKAENNIPDISPNMNNKVDNMILDISSKMKNKVGNNILDILPNMNSKVRKNISDISPNMNNNVENNIPDISPKMKNKVDNNTLDFSSNINNKVKNKIPDISPNMNSKVENNIPDISLKMNNKVENNILNIPPIMNNKVENNIPDISFNMNNKVENKIPGMSLNMSKTMVNDIPDISPNINITFLNNFPMIPSHMNITRKSQFKSGHSLTDKNNFMASGHSNMNFEPTPSTTSNIKHKYINIKATNTKIKHTYVNIKPIDANINHTDTNIIHTDTNINHTDTNINHTDTNIIHTDTNINHTDTNINHTDTNINHTYTNIKPIDANINHTDTNINHTDTNINHTDTNINHTDTNIKPIDANINHTDANIKYTDDNINHIDTNIKPTDANISHTDTNIKPIDANINHTDTNIKYTDDNINHIDTNIKPTDANISHTDTNIKPIDANINHTDTNIKPPDANIKSTDIKIKSTIINVKTAHNNINHTDIKIKPTDTNINHTDIGISNNDTNVKSTNTNIKSTDTNIQPTHTNIQPTDTKTKPTYTNIKPTHTNTKPTDTNITPTHTNIKLLDINMKPTHTNIKPTHTNIKSPDTNIKPTNTNIQHTLTNTKPTDTNTRPTHTNIQPTDTNTKPTHTNIKPTHTNIKPTDTNTRHTHTNITLLDINMKPTDTNMKPTHTNIQPTHTNIKLTDTNMKPTHTNIQPTHTNIKLTDINMKPKNTNIKPTDKQEDYKMPTAATYQNVTGGSEDIKPSMTSDKNSSDKWRYIDSHNKRQEDKLEYHKASNKSNNNKNNHVQTTHYRSYKLGQDKFIDDKFDNETLMIYTSNEDNATFNSIDNLALFYNKSIGYKSSISTPTDYKANTFSDDKSNTNKSNLNKLNNDKSNNDKSNNDKDISDKSDIDLLSRGKSNSKPLSKNKSNYIISNLESNLEDNNRNHSHMNTISSDKLKYDKSTPSESKLHDNSHGILSYRKHNKDSSNPGTSNPETVGYDKVSYNKSIPDKLNHDPAGKNSNGNAKETISQKYTRSNMTSRSYPETISHINEQVSLIRTASLTFAAMDNIRKWNKDTFQSEGDKSNIVESAKVGNSVESANADFTFGFATSNLTTRTPMISSVVANTTKIEGTNTSLHTADNGGNRSHEDNEVIVNLKEFNNTEIENKRTEKQKEAFENPNSLKKRLDLGKHIQNQITARTEKPQFHKNTHQSEQLSNNASQERLYSKERQSKIQQRHGFNVLTKQAQQVGELISTTPRPDTRIESRRPISNLTGAVDKSSFYEGLEKRVHETPRRRNKFRGFTDNRHTRTQQMVAKRRDRGDMYNRKPVGFNNSKPNFRARNGISSPLYTKHMNNAHRIDGKQGTQTQESKQLSKFSIVDSPPSTNIHRHMARVINGSHHNTTSNMAANTDGRKSVIKTPRQRIYLRQNGDKVARNEKLQTDSKTLPLQKNRASGRVGVLSFKLVMFLLMVPCLLI